jgi:hypothetical protein
MSGKRVRWSTQGKRNTYLGQVAGLPPLNRAQLLHDVLKTSKDDLLVDKYRRIYESELFLKQDLYEGEPPDIKDVLVCSRVAVGEYADGGAYPDIRNAQVWRQGGPYPTTPEGWRERVIWDYCLSRIGGNTWAEFGVWKGASAFFFLRNLPEDGRLFLFDSFEGLPEFWNDNPPGAFACDIPDFNDPRVIIKKGWFEDTLPVQEVFDFVHIDCDLYSSTKTVLDRIDVRKGTIILFDELWGYRSGLMFENTKWRDNEYKALMEWDVPYKFIARDTHGRAIEVL